MDYIESILNNIRAFNNEANVRALIDDKFFSLEGEIVRLNIEQIDRSEGSDGGPLVNENTVYSGRYDPLTTEIAENSNPKPLAPKTTGFKYNFVWTGDTLGNMALKPEARGFSIYSTGTGSDGKKAFFDGYKYFFGLNLENRTLIYYEVEFWVLQQYIKKVYG